MHAQEHSTVREGLIAGLLGAVLVATWYFVFDAAAGRPFHTPNVLGKVFFRGDLEPGVRQIVPGVVAGYTVLHVVMFAIVGTVLTLLVHLASRNLSLRMGLWMGLVVAFCFVTGVTFALNTATEARVPLWSVIGGSVVGIAGMAWFLLSRHPRIRSEVPLGDEVTATHHSPGPPRGGSV